MSEQDKSISKKGTHRRGGGGNTPNDPKDRNIFLPSNFQAPLIVVDATATSNSQPMFNQTSGAFGLLANFAQQVSIPLLVLFVWSRG